MISGWPLAVALAILLGGLFLLAVTFRSARVRYRERHDPRVFISLVGLSLSAIAITGLLCLHLSWVSPTVSQRFGDFGVRVLSHLIFWPALLALLISLFGTGKARVIGVSASLTAGLWLCTLSIAGAISMGVATARHPTRFLIPHGYVGWITVHYDDALAAPLEMANGMYVCRIPASGTLATSSKLESGWAVDEYFYYTAAGKLDPLRETGWGKGGKIWGGRTSHDMGSPAVSYEVYVGTEGQFSRGETHPVD